MSKPQIVAAPPRTLADLRADPERILDCDEAGAVLRKSYAWLAWQRSRRTGPRFIKVGRSVGYLAGDVLEYIEAGQVATRAPA